MHRFGLNLVKEADHVRKRMNHLEMWLEDPSVSKGNKRKYRELRDRTERALAVLQG